MALAVLTFMWMCKLDNSTISVTVLCKYTPKTMGTHQQFIEYAIDYWIGNSE